MWTAPHISHIPLIKSVLATPPDLLVHVSAQEPARVKAILDHVLPASMRTEGLRSDPYADKRLTLLPLDTLRLPTLVFSARDERNGACARAGYTVTQIPGARFIGLEKGAAFGDTH